MTQPLKVAIDVPLLDEKNGGVRQFIMGLAHGLSHLSDGDERYVFFTHPGSLAWLQEHIGGPCEVSATPGFIPPPDSTLKALVKRLEPAWATRLRHAAYNTVLGSSLRAAVQPVYVPPSSGAVEASGAEVIHFPTQNSYATNLPAVYQPHDLNHRHFPQFFSPYYLDSLETIFRDGCARASLVVMMSRFGRNDLHEKMGVPLGKIAVIEGGSIFEAYSPPTPEALKTAGEKLGLCAPYLFYPATTMAHKNHPALLRAVALLRDREGLAVRIYFPGHRHPNFPEIEKELKALRLEQQCRFLGYVSQEDLRCVLAMARGMVFPSLMEGWGLPLTEAMHAGVPAAVADNSMLTEQGGDAVLAFDPRNIEAMAGAVKRLWSDDGLRAELAAKGRQRAELFQWKKVVKIHRAHYRRLAGRALSEEDRALIERSMGSAPF